MSAKLKGVWSASSTPAFSLLLTVRGELHASQGSSLNAGYGGDSGGGDSDSGEDCGDGDVGGGSDGGEDDHFRFRVGSSSSRSMTHVRRVDELSMQKCVQS